MAQIKLSTARDVINIGIYKGVPKKISKFDLYNLLLDDDNSIEFASAYIKRIYDYHRRKKNKINFNIVATCYSHGLKNLKSSERGKLIVNKFMLMAKELFK